MYAAIYIANFRLQSVLRHGGGVAAATPCHGQPVALVEGDATKGTVIEMTASAHASGVHKGMASAQAMARCNHLIFKSRSISAERSATEILLQTMYAFSPNIEETGPGVCTMDMRGLGLRDRHFTPIEADQSQQQFAFLDEAQGKPLPGVVKGCDSELVTWAERLLAAMAAVHLPAQVGIAATPALALLAARAAEPVVVVADARQFVAALPVSALDPAPDVLNVLQRWGIRHVGELIALGRENIAERLGAEALELFERASIHAIRPLHLVTPSTTFEEQMDFEAHIETLEPLLFVLRRFIEQLCARITLTYCVISELTLVFKLETGVPWKKRFKIPAPTSDVETLFRMVHTHLESLRTESAIVSLRLEARPCRPGKQQFGLFESALRDPNQFDETLARLSALLGVDRVGTPVMENTHRPDSFRMEHPQFANGSAVPATCRRRHGGIGPALRRFRDPIPIHVEMKQGHPAFVTSLKINSAVRCSRGPWITSGDWWDRHRWSRNEWDVELRDGAIYRLFTQGDQWLLEGVYD